MIFLRLAFNAGLLLLMYYIGRELGRTEPLRREMREHRERLRNGAAGGAAGGGEGDQPPGGVRNPVDSPR